MLILMPRNSKSAVWNATLRHVELIAQSDPQVQLICHKKDAVYIDDFTIITYSTFLERAWKIWARRRESLFVISSRQMCSIPWVFLMRQIDVCYWIQGLVSEESYLRNRSRLRRKVLQIMEKIAFLRADKIVYVSESMKNFIETRMGKNHGTAIVIPCASDFQCNEVGPREKRIVYVGGISVWQRLDKCADIFNSIHEEDPDYSLDFITEEPDLAWNVINKAKITQAAKERIRVFSISNRRCLAQALTEYRWGFLLRDESPVNLVSSPIKFAEYLSCGVNVIVSDSIPHLAGQVRDFGSGVVVDNTWKIPKLPNASAEASYLHYAQEFNVEILAERYAGLLG